MYELSLLAICAVGLTCIIMGTVILTEPFWDWSYLPEKALGFLVFFAGVLCLVNLYLQVQQ